MALSHGKLSLRFALKEKFFSVLNIVGLAIGIATCILLMLVLKNDLTYDRHYPNHDRIYRLGAHYGIPGSEGNTGSTARELGSILRDVYPEIEELVRVHHLGTSLVSTESAPHDAYYEGKVYQADSTYFRIFGHEFLAGDRQTCMNDPLSVVITESVAHKYFPVGDALNKIILINSQPRKVTGIAKDFPYNTHLKFDFLLAGLPEIRQSWDSTYLDGKPISLVFWNPDVMTYLLLPDDYDPTVFYSRFDRIYNDYFKETADETGGEAFNIPVLLPLADIHLSNFDDWGGDRTLLSAFSAIGFLILLLACINYINLSTSKSAIRAKDISMRRISGASRTSLIFSLLGESLILSTASLVVAMLLIWAVLDLSSFNQLIQTNLRFEQLSDPTLLLGSFAIAILIGLISGAYPAFYLTAIPTALALKGEFRRGKSGTRLRKVLVMTQFVITIFVVSCTLMMKRQIAFVQSSDLGFDKDNQLIIPVRDPEAFEHVGRIKNQLLLDHRIRAVTTSAALPGLGIGGNVMYGEGPDGQMQERGGILGNFVGDDYLNAMGISLIQGRDFRQGAGVDEDGIYIANEAAVRLMGWGDDAVGKKVSFWDGMNAGEVVGVVKDFNASSLHTALEPMFIVKGHFDSGYLQIRLAGDQVPETIEFVKHVWMTYVPERPFEFFFLDEKFNQQYGDDIRSNSLLTGLAVTCILISLLGIIGLAAFSATLRTKEIGVRKVFGASLPEVIYLLSSGTLKLFILAAVVSFPVTWLVVNRWLETFAYKSPLSMGVYLLVAMIGLTIVLLTIAFQSFRAVGTSPSESLRNE